MMVKSANDKNLMLLASGVGFKDDTQFKNDISVELGKGANINARTNSKSTPLMIVATWPTSGSILRHLISCGADITARGERWIGEESDERMKYKFVDCKSSDPNALDIILALREKDQNKNLYDAIVLLACAAVDLPCDKQREFLKNMPERNALLFVAKNFPHQMGDMVTLIQQHAKGKNDPALIQRILSVSELPHKIANQYLLLFSLNAEQVGK